MSAEAQTLIELLQQRSQSGRADSGFRFLTTGDVDGPSQAMSFAELDRRARALAARLLELGYRGERALMLFPPGLDFIVGFFGCIYAGVIAVPAYPPEPARLAASLPRLQGIVRDARPALMLTTAMVEQLSAGLGQLAPELGVLEVVAVDSCELAWADEWRAPAISPDSLAFLQYTSGSTGSPRGVMVSHRNLIDHQWLYHELFYLEDPRVVSWLPPYHDLGLIGTLLGPIHHDAPTLLYSPLDFLKRPLSWIRAISKFRATSSGGPDFAYALCARRARPEDLAGIDLSCWQRAFMGAEPLRPETLREFVRVFGPVGFDARAMMPAFGLAEATLGVTSIRPGRGPRTFEFDADALAAGKVKLGHGRELVDCGAPLPGTELAFLRDDGSKAEPDELAEICVRSPAVTRGYWEQPELNRSVFESRGPDGRTWLRTGDLGFAFEGGLFIAARKKDLIILRGRNIYPQDIELTVEHAHAAIRPGCIAAFALPLADGGEGLGIAAEVADGAELEAVQEAITAAVAREHGVGVDGLALIPGRALPKTSSGKIQRRAAAKAWLEGSLAPLRRLGAEPPAIEGLPAWLLDHLVEEAKLPRDRLRRDVKLDQLGLDSLALVQLAGAIEERLGAEVPLEVVYGRTLGELADWLAHTSLPSALAKGPDLEAAAELGPLQFGPRSRGDDVLLTGATGLLGAFVLAELLARSRVRVVCLVRAQDREHAHARLRDVASKLELTLDFGRIDVVIGDLARPRLGLDEHEWTALAGRCGRIIHCGAQIDWMARFEDLRPSNVDGTIEIVRLAASGGGIPIHHVSSLGVFPLGLSHRAEFGEDEEPSEGELLRIAYFQSKWAAERVLAHARAQGVPVSVYRPGFIAGHSRSGVELRSADQLLHAFIVGTLRMGLVPAVEKVVELVPVDFVAAVVARASLRDDLGGRCFNLLNPAPMQQSEFHAVLRARGYSLAELPYPQWRARLLRLPREDPESPLARFALYYRTITPQVMRRLEQTLAERMPIADAGARALLEQLDVRCPPLDARLLGTYLDYYRDRGLLP
jgi:thioester reductase-like protein